MDDKQIVGKTTMKDIINALIEKHGSLRKAAKFHDMDHQLMSRWQELDSKVPGQAEFLRKLEQFRADLGIPDSKFWKRIKRT